MPFQPIGSSTTQTPNQMGGGFKPIGQVQKTKAGVFANISQKNQKRNIFDITGNWAQATFGRAGEYLFGDAVDLLAERVPETFGKFMQREISPVQSTVRTAGDIVAAGTEVAGKVLSPVLKGMTAVPGPIKAVKDLSVEFLKTDLGKAGIEAVGQGIEVYKQWKETNPEAARDLEAVVNVASILPIERVAQVGFKAAGVGIKSLEKGIEYSFEAAKVQRVAKARTEVERAVGAIVQGKTKDKTPALRAILDLDTDGVKTFKDLYKLADEKIGEVARVVDERLATNTKRFTLKETTTKARVGGQEASASYVKSAIDDLVELYSKTNDVENLARMKDIQQRFEFVGLSIKEMNDLARGYGVEFGRKAFGKSGEALTSVNATRFENTRSGVKNTVRNLYGDDAAKALDLKMTDLFSLRDNVGKMVEKVNALQQRIIERNLIEKVFRGIGQVVDVATFGGPKAFITKFLFPSNVGLKTLNSLEIEKLLSKNLEKITDLLKSEDDNFVSGLRNLLNLDDAKPTQLPKAPGAATPKTATTDFLIRDSYDTPQTRKTLEAFAKSQNREILGEKNGEVFSLGSFGRQAEKRKQSKHDRFFVDELSETISHIKKAYRASDDPKKYRIDNIAWVAKMPGGETRILYTRKNSLGQNEFLSWNIWNKDTHPKFIETLKTYGEIKIPE